MENEWFVPWQYWVWLAFMMLAGSYAIAPEVVARVWFWRKTGELPEEKDKTLRDYQFKIVVIPKILHELALSFYLADKDERFLQRQLADGKETRSMAQLKSIRSAVRFQKRRWTTACKRLVRLGFKFESNYLEYVPDDYRSEPEFQAMLKKRRRSLPLGKVVS